MEAKSVNVTTRIRTQRNMQNARLHVRREPFAPGLVATACKKIRVEDAAVSVADFIDYQEHDKDTMFCKGCAAAQSS